MNVHGLSRLILAVFALTLFSLGCNSPYRSDQGAVVGGLTGAGLGALVGGASGHPGAGAAIGAGVGALSGAAVGGSLDDIEANNRAEIAARLGRPAPSGAVTIDDVIAMSRAGVTEDIIVTHVRTHGAAGPLRPNDLIVLQLSGAAGDGCRPTALSLRLSLRLPLSLLLPPVSPRRGVGRQRRPLGRAVCQAIVRERSSS